MCLSGFFLFLLASSEKAVTVSSSLDSELMTTSSPPRCTSGLTISAPLLSLTRLGAGLCRRVVEEGIGIEFELDFGFGVDLDKA